MTNSSDITSESSVTRLTTNRKKFTSKKSELLTQLTDWITTLNWKAGKRKAPKKGTPTSVGEGNLYSHHSRGSSGVYAEHTQGALLTAIQGFKFVLFIAFNSG